MQALEKRHTDMVRELNMDGGRASKIMNGVQPYKRDLVVQLAQWLGVRPYELLMPPDEAINLRRIRETAYAIVAEQGAAFDTGPAPASKASGRPGRA